MRVCHLAKWVVASFLLSILVACGGGSSGTGCADGGFDCQTTPESIDAMGTDGPLLDAIVAVYHLQAFLDAGPGSFPASLIPATRTDSVTGLAEDLSLDLNSGNGPFILVVQADASTTDLTTGNPPEITTLTRVITSSDFTQSPRPRFYATALTTLAYEYAKAQAASATANLVVGELVNAGSVVIQNFGFDIDSTVDVFNTPPVLDSTTTSLSDQQVVASHRAALETFAEMLKQVASTVGSITGQDVFDVIVADISDGLVGNNGQLPTSIEGRVVSEIDGVTPTYLTTGTGRLPVGATPIQTLLDGEISGFTPPVASGGSIDATPEVPDWDGDTVPNNIDDFPYDATKTTDFDNDLVDDVFGAGDNCIDTSFGGADTILNNPADLNNPDQTDSDGDLVGNICDADADGDSVTDTSDNCKVGDTYNPGELLTNGSQTNTDNDAFGDICDADIDGDGALNANDADPLDPLVILDADGDGVDEVIAPVDNCVHTSFGGLDTFNPFTIVGSGVTRQFSTTVQLLDDPNQGDLDLNGVGDICDNNADGDALNNDQDGAPFDASIGGDADSDGVDDASDNCIDTSFGGSTTIINNPADLNNPDQTDTDTDGLGDICDLDKDGDLIPNVNDPDPLSEVFDYHFDVWLSGTESFTALDQFELFIGSEGAVRTDTSTSIDLVNNNILDLGTNGLGNGTLALDKGHEVLESILTLGGACTAGADCTLASTPAIDSTGATVPNVITDPVLAAAVYVPGTAAGTLALDFGKVSLEAVSATSFTVETLQEYGASGLLLSAFGQSFVGTERVDGLTYAILTGDACAVAIGVGAYTDQNDLQAKLDLLTPSAVAPLASGNCGTPLSNVKDQQLLVVAPEASALATSDFNASSYGLVELDVNFTTATATDLVQMNSRVSSIDVTDAAGSVTQNAATLYASEMGSEEVGSTSDGQLTFVTASANVTALIAGVSGEGELALTRGGNTVVGFAAKDLELLTFVGRNAGTATDTTTLDRAYAVKLGTGVTATSLDGMAFDVQGLTYGASNQGLLMSTFKGSSITFTEEAGSLLSAQLTLGASGSVEGLFDDANSNLPVLASLSETKGLNSAVDFAIDSSGRFGPVSFSNSGLELEGFYSAATGLLLRVIETKAETVGAGSATLYFIFGTVSADGLGIDWVIPPPQPNPDPLLPAPLPTGFYGWWDGADSANPVAVTTAPADSIPGSFSGGQVVVPPAGNTYFFAAEARANPGTAQNFGVIDIAGGDIFIKNFIRQGVLFGTPQNP